MRTIAAFLFLFFTLQVSAQVLDRDSVNVIDANGKRQGYWIITGAMLKSSLYKPAAKVEEGTYVDGRKEGKWIRYYPNGKVEREAYYVNNLPTGFYKTFFDSANHVQSEGTFLRNRNVGAYTLYYPNGSKRQQFNYDSLGRRTGMQYYFWDNGNVMIEANYVDGHRHGWSKEYYANGLLKSEKHYVMGIYEPEKTKLYPQNEYVKVNPRK